MRCGSNPAARCDDQPLDLAEGGTGPNPARRLGAGALAPAARKEALSGPRTDPAHNAGQRALDELPFKFD
jgi:hypothetical protein